MIKVINITVENKFLVEKRDLNVYHQSTRSAHIISHNSSLAVPLRSISEDDYLHVSVVSGPGHLQNNSVISLPAWVEFDFSSAPGNVSLSHSGDRLLLKIPAGPPTWQLKVTQADIVPGRQASNRITLGDELTMNKR